MAKDRIAKMEEMFPDTDEPKKKYPPVEEPNERQSTTGHGGGHTPREPLPTEPPREPDPGLLADLVAQNNTGLKFSETTTELQKPIPMRRKLDPELKAMDEVCEILEKLEPAMRGRVLAWACQKFKIYPSGVIMHIAEAGPAPEINLR